MNTEQILKRAEDKYTTATVYGKDGFQIVLSNLLRETIDETKSEIISLIMGMANNNEILLLDCAKIVNKIRNETSLSKF
jgi:hypothetical protein